MKIYMKNIKDEDKEIIDNLNKYIKNCREGNKLSLSLNLQNLLTNRLLATEK